MSLRWWPLSVALALAAVAHIAAALAVRGAPLVGTDGFSRTVSELLKKPDLVATSEAEPVRVFLGSVERAPVEAPGPRPVLDPASSRKPPHLGSEWRDRDKRLAVARPLFMPSAREAAEPMRARPPGLDAPSGADREVAGLAINLNTRELTRPLPARFVPAPSLAGLAASARPALRPREAKLEFPIDRAVPLPPPHWPEPDRPLRVPEVFVDVLDIGR